MGSKTVHRTANTRRATFEDMSINHRRLDVTMTQEFLYRSNLARYYFNRRLIDPRMRAPILHFSSPLRERARWSPTARVQRGSYETARCTSTGDRSDYVSILITSPRGVPRLSFTARIEGLPNHRGASASKKDSLGTPLSSVSPISTDNARYRTTQWGSEIEAHLLYAIVETATCEATPLDRKEDY